MTTVAGASTEPETAQSTATRQVAGGAMQRDVDSREVSGLWNCLGRLSAHPWGEEIW